MFRWTKKNALVSLNCPRCLTPPPYANHCPQCGKALPPSKWVTLQSKEIEFDDFDETKEVFASISVRISDATEEEVSGVWRLADEVRRPFTLRPGEWAEWEVPPRNKVYVDDDRVRSEKPLNELHCLGFLDFNSETGTVTLAIRTIAKVRISDPKDQKV
jgi:hypothetical protein